jgi:hypothetical protein
MKVGLPYNCVFIIFALHLVAIYRVRSLFILLGSTVDLLICPSLFGFSLMTFNASETEFNSRLTISLPCGYLTVHGSEKFINLWGFSRTILFISFAVLFKITSGASTLINSLSAPSPLRISSTSKLYTTYSLCFCLRRFLALSILFFRISLICASVTLL